MVASKSYTPEPRYAQREEFVAAIRYVDEVVPSPWLIDEDFLDQYEIDLLVHADDDNNPHCKNLIACASAHGGNKQ